MAREDYEIVMGLEVHCELYVKKILEGLSPEEEKLFDYLGGDFKN